MGKQKKSQGRSRRRKRQKTNKVQSFTSFPLLAYSSSCSTNPEAIFPISLAAALTTSSNSPTNQILLKICLKKLRHLLLHQNPCPDHPEENTLYPILSLLPSLLHSPSPEIAQCSAQIVGAASLLSLEANEKIAVDEGTVKGLVSLLGSFNVRVSMVACNAILDLSTTSIGRQRLLNSFALDRLLSEFLQVPASSTSVSLCSDDERQVSLARIAFKQNTYPISILSACIGLINSCNIRQLGKIQRSLLENFLIFLKSMWQKVHEQMLHGRVLKCCQGKELYLSNIRANDLAETIFRLSIESCTFEPLPSASIKRRIFGENETSFETFILNYWESLPFHVSRLSNSIIEEDDVFALISQSFDHKELSSTFIPSMLQSFISCLPIASEELDILSFLEEVSMELGCPLIYDQDIRILRTEKKSGRELHFLDKITDAFNVNSHHFFNMAGIMKCEEAFKEGYTIAVRGMEFRFGIIAAIADALASVFGLPSVGANMYLTPPSSQGLARHCDDHCVFVFQLIGTKQWKIFPQSNTQLPRLYDSLSSKCDLEVEFSPAETRELLLMEGDILYIPRGVAHEACASASDPFSLHLTFSIEVEPPFEWEGFVHVALCFWTQMQNQAHEASVESSSQTLYVMSVNLLHAMIELIGASDPTFRKACLVGALSLPVDHDYWLYVDQKTFFMYVINKLSLESRFSNVLQNVELAIKKDEDPFRRMRWLQLLEWERETIEKNDWKVPFMEVQMLMPLYIEYQYMAEEAFQQVKSKFCAEVSFEEVIDSYKMLLEKYKTARRRYTNGMLSLHCH